MVSAFFKQVPVAKNIGLCYNFPYPPRGDIGKEFSFPQTIPSGVSMSPESIDFSNHFEATIPREYGTGTFGR